MNYQKILKDNLKSIYENYINILETRTEHVNFEVQIKAAEIVRSFQALILLVSEIRTFLIINDLDTSSQTNHINPQAPLDSMQQQQRQIRPVAVRKPTPADTDEKLIRLRDEMSMFLYELEIPLP